MGVSSRSLLPLFWPLRALGLAAGALSRAVRRRRFRPSALRGCVLWLRPEAGISSTWGLVTRWTDRKRRIALVARAPTDCPTFVDQSTGLQDRAALRFDDGGGLLETPGTMRMSPDGQLSVFVVLSPSRPWARGFAPLRPRMCALSWICGSRMVALELDGHNELLATVDGAQVQATGVRLMAGRPYLLGLIVTADTAAVLVNGARVKTFTVDGDLAAAFTAKLRIGSGRRVRERFSGDVGDVLIYDCALDALACAAVASALTRRYGIGRPHRPRAIDRLRRVLHRVRDRLADFCYGTPRPD